jgi:hypothetical protein
VDYTDKEVTLVLRGDELERLNDLIEETGFDNEARLSLLCYLRNQIAEQIEGIDAQ